MTSPADSIAAARLVLESLGLSATDLIESEPPTTKVMPTFTQYVPVVAAATPPSSREQWMNYWRVLESEWGDQRIDIPTLSDLIDLSDKVHERANTRKQSRGGLGAQSNFVDAVKRFYRLAVGDNLIEPNCNPAAGLRRPKQLRTRRRALSATQLAEVTDVAGTTGKDPALDTLVLRQHTETACRRSGVLNLRNIDLNVQECTIWLREKSTVREQPVSQTLMNALVDHSQRRNPHPGREEAVFRRLDGHPLNDYYYQSLWQRLGKHLPWVAERGVTAHWIRYTTLNWVERNFGYAIAAAYAGHVPGSSTVGNTLTYVGATLEELATTLAVLVGEPHPSAVPGYHPTDDTKLILRLREPDDLPIRLASDLGTPPLSERTPRRQEHGSPVHYEHLTAIRLVRRQLEQAHQDGRRRPTQRALVYTTGLTPYAVRGALNALKIGWGDASRETTPQDDALVRLISSEPRRR